MNLDGISDYKHECEQCLKDKARLQAELSELELILQAEALAAVSYLSYTLT